MFDEIATYGWFGPAANCKSIATYGWFLDVLDFGLFIEREELFSIDMFN